MKRFLYVALIVIFAAAFLISAITLGNYFYQSVREQSRYDDLAQLMENAQPSEPPPLSEGEPTQPGETQPPPTSPWVQVNDPETGETVDVLPEFAALYEMNNDIVGWLTIPGTVINYPVMQTRDAPDYYLHKNFDKEYSAQGCLYAREVCDVFTPSDNITIYGHRMKDGSMFSALEKYQSKSFWEENPTLTFNTLTQRQTYEVLAVFITTATIEDGFHYHLFVDAYDESQFNEFVSTCKALSYYDTGVNATFGDKFITLSTCDYADVNGRLVLVAKRTDADES